MAETKIVKMVADMKFEPEEVTIQVGDTIKWINESTMRHTVTRDEGEPLFESGALAQNAEFEFTFSEPSDDSGFFYYCRLHGQAMGGTVFVQPAVTTVEPTVVKMVAGMKFEPEEVTIQVGNTVKWINESTMRHTVTRDEGEPLFESGALQPPNDGQPGGEFEFTFLEPSDDSGFFYYCRLHGQAMSGIVFVRSATETNP